MAGRLTRIFLQNDEGGVFAMGAGYSVIDPANDVVRYRAPPEFFTSETGGAAFVPAGVPSLVPAFVDTGVLSTDLAQLFSSEMALTTGSFHAQTEAVFSHVTRPSLSAVSFYGVSAQCGYILTGEHRPYDRSNGTLGRVVPNCPFGDGGKGAWEIAARWSLLDLNDADVLGGNLANTTLGLNWYLNKFTKFQFNYIFSQLDSPVNGDSNANIVAARAQVDF